MDAGSRDPGARPAAGEYDAIVIGAGFAGLYQLHLLRDRLGLRVHVVEAAAGVGGTWWWNRYPGARCDSESLSYCYFFSPEIYAEWEWSERYPGQEEIRGYLDFVADRLDLRRDIRFSTRVTGARRDDAAGRWIVETDSGESLSATYLITAVGCLSSANVPKIPGLDRFEGRWYHTGSWPHEGVELRGKRVGQIGTGSTGIQIAPVLAAEAEHLTVFQRTANYSVPARNRPLTPEEKKRIREDYAETREIVRATTNGHAYHISARSALETSPDERRALYETAWETGGLRFRTVFGDLLTSVEANDTAADYIREKIRERVEDPEKARVLSDIDHPYAAKRPPIDTDYFETFNRDNVALVDLRAEPVEEITPRGVRTSAREYPLDVIVFATGFDALTGPLLALNIRGRDGIALRDLWREGPKTLLGLQIPGFPNLFTISGPGSPSVLTNMPVSIEQHAEWIADCIAWLRENGVASIEASTEAAAEWGAHVNEVAGRTLLPSVRHSWYLGANVPGKPRAFMPYAGGLARYRKICDDVATRGYPGFVIANAPARSDASLGEVVAASESVMSRV